MLAMPVTQKSVDSPLVRPQRLLRLISLLEGGNAGTGGHLAKAFNVCKRTIFRDIKLLRTANVPIAFDSVHGSYRIQRSADPCSPNSGMPTVLPSAWKQNGSTCSCPKIKANEIVALLLAIRVVGPLPLEIAGPCETAIAKILGAALPSVREEAISILEHYVDGSSDSRHETVLPLRQSG